MSAVLECRDCGKQFNARRSDALRCDSCRELDGRTRQQRYEQHKREPCPGCGKPMVRRARACITCTNKRRGEERKGEGNGNWKKGRFKSNGYVFVRTSNEPGSNAYTSEHKLVWEEANGPMPKGWVVHHLNGIKDDNRLGNLEGMPRHQHHTHPREALKPYEERIRQLEDALKASL